MVDELNLYSYLVDNAINHIVLSLMVFYMMFIIFIFLILTRYHIQIIVCPSCFKARHRSLWQPVILWFIQSILYIV